MLKEKISLDFDFSTIGKKAPYGYTKNYLKYFEIVPEEAENVVLMYQMYADGCPYEEILKELSNKKAVTKYGNEFGKNSILDILSNEKYLGISLDGGFMVVPKIIDDELFEKVKERREQNASKSNKKRRTYMLKGKIICGLCGHTLTGNFHTHKDNGHTYEVRAYRCNNHLKATKCSCREINADYLEKFVIDSLLQDVFKLENIDKLYDDMKDFYEENNKLCSDENCYLMEYNKFKTEINEIHKILMSHDLDSIQSVFKEYVDHILIDETNVTLFIHLDNFVFKKSNSFEIFIKTSRNELTEKYSKNLNKFKD